VTKHDPGETPLWVDFHCHLDLYPNHVELIAECDQKSIATLTVTTTPKAWARNRELASVSSHVSVALGLHPQLVAERADELPLFERLLEEARYVGEVGLDAGPRFYHSFREQERIFERVLTACCEQGDKVLSIHSVRSVSKVLWHLEQQLARARGSTVRAILHWFTGSVAEASRALQLGCYFSINDAMLKSPKHRRLVAKLPLDRILTETDGPFVKHVGRAIRPHDVRGTVAELASIRGLTAENLARAIVSNLASLTTKVGS
jgi:TatD DNase family protein